MKDKVSINYMNFNKKLKRYKNKTINKVFFSDTMYNGNIVYRKNIIINNFIIDLNKGYLKNKSFSCSLYNVKSKNICFGEESDIEGLNISLDSIMEHSIPAIEFCWYPDEARSAEVEKLNIIFKNKEYNIDLNKTELKSIVITPVDWNKFKIIINHTNSEIIYELNEDNLSKTIISIFISKSELEDGEIDLTVYDNFDAISLGDVNIETLKIKKEDINNLHKIKLYDGVYIKNIKVIDNEMKLNPEKIIPFNSVFDTLGKYVTDSKENILIYVDSENILRVYNKKDNKEELDFVIKKEDYTVVSKYNNKYKIIIDGTEYEITNLLLFYLKENIDRYTYKTKDALIYLEQKDYTSLIDECMSNSNFLYLYTDYKIFKNNLKKLFKRGFTYEYFMYLYERGLVSIIFKMCESDFDIDKFDDNEIKELNSLSKRYVKNKEK